MNSQNYKFFPQPLSLLRAFIHHAEWTLSFLYTLIYSRRAYPNNSYPLLYYENKNRILQHGMCVWFLEYFYQRSPPPPYFYCIMEGCLKLSTQKQKTIWTTKRDTQTFSQWFNGSMYGNMILDRENKPRSVKLHKDNNIIITLNILQLQTNILYRADRDYVYKSIYLKTKKLPHFRSKLQHFLWISSWKFHLKICSLFLGLTFVMFCLSVTKCHLIQR